jgi:aromatic-L-amino-acid decarboxylase
LPGITHWGHGKFMAYFPANTTFESIIADMYATSVTNPGFNWVCSPACTELEQVTMDWMAQILGLEQHFQLSHGVGGGVILVRGPTYPAGHLI